MDLIFNGISASSLGLKIVSAGSGGPADDALEMPVRDVTVETVPGVNGEYLIDNGRWLPVELVYECAFVGDVARTMAKVRQWLAVVGRKKLVDTRFPGEYRMARVSAPLSPSTFGRGRGATLQLCFTAQPERWLDSGEARILPSVVSWGLRTGGYRILNPSPCDAYPRLRFWLGRARNSSSPVTVSFYTGTGTGSVTVSGLVGAYEDGDDTPRELVTLDGVRKTAEVWTVSSQWSTPSVSFTGELVAGGDESFSIRDVSSTSGGSYSTDWQSLQFELYPRWFRL